MLLGGDNWELVIHEDKGLKILRSKGVLLSPSILDCLGHESTQMVNYDPFKADIFTVGMIVLECCSLKKAEDFYDYENLLIKED